MFWLKDKWLEREIKWKPRLSWMTVKNRKKLKGLVKKQRWTTERATTPGIRSLFWLLSGYLRSVKHGCASSCTKTSAKWRTQVAMVVNNNQSRNLFFIHQTYKLGEIEQNAFLASELILNYLKHITCSSEYCLRDNLHVIIAYIDRTWSNCQYHLNFSASCDTITKPGPSLCLRIDVFLMFVPLLHVLPHSCSSFSSLIFIGSW